MRSEDGVCYVQLNSRCFTAWQKIASWKCGKLPLVPMENLFTVYGKEQALSHKPANRFPTAPPGLAVYAHSHNVCCCEYPSDPFLSIQEKEAEYSLCPNINAKRTGVRLTEILPRSCTPALRYGKCWKNVFCSSVTGRSSLHRKW